VIATEEKRAKRKVMEGIVLSDKMEKTRVVSVERRLRHRKYAKVLIRSTALYAHDEKNESRAGDRVRVMETRPLSKLKRWRLVEVLQKARVGHGVEPTAEENP
jgi:small subunit ribosomal protein S17